MDPLSTKGASSSPHAILPLLEQTTAAPTTRPSYTFAPGLSLQLYA